MACASGLANDVGYATCAGWCKASEVSHHCAWCKCSACSFCPHADVAAPAAPALLAVPQGRCGPGSSSGPLRLTACGADLYSSDGSPRPLLLSGVNVYLEWLITYHEKAREDVAKLRRAVPSANLVRFVALLWHDSVKESDGLECGSDDASRGYLSAACLDAMDGFVRQATDAGLWVIVAARAKYAAGWDWPEHPDVFHDDALQQRYYAMLRFVAARYATWGRTESRLEPSKRSVEAVATRPA